MVLTRLAGLKHWRRGAEGQVTGAGWGEKATAKRLAAFIICDAQCQHSIWLNARHVMKQS